jgi:hypothetical protein
VVAAAGAAAAVLDTHLHPLIQKKIFNLIQKCDQDHKKALAPHRQLDLNCNSYQPGVNDEHDIPDQSEGAVPQ